MPASYEEAVGALHRAAHESWVAERKRLAAELKASGDKAGAARLAKLGRPPLSAWAVNQLWWREPEAFRELFAAAGRLRVGDASAAHTRREAVAALRSRAAALLVDAGHAANEATLRRVTTTLSALAAAGSFEPDLPGALSADRDPPGFDTPGLAEALARSVAPPAGALGDAPGAADVASADLAGPGTNAPAPEAGGGDGGGARSDPGSAEGGSVAEALAAAMRATDELAAAERESARRAVEAREQAAQAAAEAGAASRADVEHTETEREARREQERLRRDREQRRAERARLEENLVGLRGDLERRRREVDRLKGEVARVEGLAHEAETAIMAAERELEALGPAD